MKISRKIHQCCQLGALVFFFASYPSLVLAAMDIERKAAVANKGSGQKVATISQRLIGTAVSKNPDETFAVIEDVRNRQQKLYREGDQVGNILIKKILPGRIVVDRGRGEEVVKLRRSQIVKGAGPLRLPGSTMQLAFSNPERKNGPRDRHYLIDGSAVANALADPKKLQQDVELQQGRLFNRPRGVRIGALSIESVFPAMGLRKGDLLLGVNNQVINTPDDAVAMLQIMFDNGSEAELKVRRRARTYRIHLQDLQVK